MGMQSEAFSIGKYLVHGFVVDEEGVPVEGAAIRVGKELAYTNSTGRFSARFSKRGPFAIMVAHDEFITNAIYETISAPPDARAELDDNTADLKIVVRKVAPRQAKTGVQ